MRRKPLYTYIPVLSTLIDRTAPRWHNIFTRGSFTDGLQRETVPRSGRHQNDIQKQDKHKQWMSNAKLSHQMEMYRHHYIVIWGSYIYIYICIKRVKTKHDELEKKIKVIE